MPKRSNIFSFLQAQDWAMDRAFLDAAMTVLAASERGVRSSPRDLEALAFVRSQRGEGAELAAGFDGLAGVDPNSSDTFDERPMYSHVGHVALMPVHGMVAKYASMVHGISSADGMTTNRITEGMIRAIRDRKTQTLVLDIDSPGGTVAGMDQVLQVLRDNRRGLIRGSEQNPVTVPVWAHCSDLTASGGYLIAAFADQIVVGESSKVGCLGVYRVIEDSSKAFEEMGITRKVIASRPPSGNTVKGAGEPGTPITPDMELHAQEQVDAMGEWFAAAIAEGRGVPVEAIRELCDGRMWVGPRAVEIGLADAVGSLKDLVIELNAAIVPGIA